MIVNCFQINEMLQLESFPPEKAVETSEAADTRIWLDLSDPEPAELEAWLDRLGVTDLTRRLCTEGRDRPGFYPLKKEIFLVLPFIHNREDYHEVEYITFLCRENLLFSIHHKVIMNSEQVSVFELSQDWLPSRSIAGLISAILINMSLTFLNYATGLRKSILALEDRVDRTPDKVGADEILSQRSDLNALGTVVGDQLPSLMAMSKINKPFFPLDDAQEYMNCALVNLQAVDSSLDWMDGRISALHAGFDMHAQDQTNRRLNMLTILSAIFNPATLLVGFWGMNFTNMPLLEKPYGYHAACGLILLTGVFMYLFFRRGGWFD